MPSAIVVHGLKKPMTVLHTLPTEMDKEFSMSNIVFLKAVRKSAKLRLVRNSMTGTLKDSIKIIPTKIKGKVKQSRLVVDNPYGIFQEEGYKGHFVHAGTSTRNSLGTIGDAYNVAGFMWIKKSKGLHFIRNAVEKQLSTFSQKLNNAARRAIIQ